MADKTELEPSSISRRRHQARTEPSAGYIEKRDQLLKAAGEVFKRKGLEATSINDIAAEFGGDRASVYYYYSSKDEIFHDLVGRVIEDLVVATEAIAHGEGSATVKLAALMELVFDSYEVNYPYQYIYIQEDMTRREPREGESSARVIALGHRYEATILGVIREGLAKGELRKEVDPHMLTLAILGSVNWSHRWFKPGGRKSGAALGREFAEYFLAGVATGRSPTR